MRRKKRDLAKYFLSNVVLCGNKTKGFIIPKTLFILINYKIEDIGEGVKY
jgi:hypothetical protein